MFIPTSQLYSCKLNLESLNDKGDKFLKTILRHAGIAPDYVADSKNLINFWRLMLEKKDFDNFRPDIESDDIFPEVICDFSSAKLSPQTFEGCLQCVSHKSKV